MPVNRPEWIRLYMKCSLTFILFFYQPSVINHLVSMISCRQLAGDSYINADLTQICEGNDYVIYSLAFVLPFLILWGLVFPIVYFTTLSRNST